MASLRDYTLLSGLNGRVWQIRNSSETAMAQRDGLQYIIKLYARYPAGYGSAARPEDDAEQYLRILRKLRSLNHALAEADAGTGRIAYATEVIDERSGEDIGIMEAVPVVAGGKDLSCYTGCFDDRLALLPDIADAVALVHSANIRHGDLKLENVLVYRDFGGERAVLIDFDHACMEGDVPDGFHIGGTDGYQAPEILDYIDFYDENEMDLIAMNRSDDSLSSQRMTFLLHMTRRRMKITGKADIYSLGVLFYLFLTNQWPFDANGQIEVSPAALHDRDDLAKLIRAMLENDPAARPDAAQVATCLRRKRFVTYLPLFEAVWPEHEGYQYQTMAGGRKVTKIQRVEIDGEKSYTVTCEGFPPRIFTFAMMRRSGILKQNTMRDA